MRGDVHELSDGRWIVAVHEGPWRWVSYDHGEDGGYAVGDTLERLGASGLVRRYQTRAQAARVARSIYGTAREIAEYRDAGGEGGGR